MPVLDSTNLAALGSTELSILAIWVAVLGIWASFLIALSGWKKDRIARDETYRTKCLQSLVELLNARQGPLHSPSWTGADSMAANVFHVAAYGAMQAVSKGRQDIRVVQHIAAQSFAMQEEAGRYARSAEAKTDVDAGIVGMRRASIYSSVAWMQDELLDWQNGKLKGKDLHSFWWHYCDALLKLPGTLTQPPTSTDDRREA